MPRKETMMTRQRLAMMVGLLLMPFWALGASGDSVSGLKNAGKLFEIKPMVEPEWVNRPDNPLFTLAWMSDYHIVDENSKNQVAKACSVAKFSIRPAFTLITGDNCGMPFTDTATATAGELRQKWFKAFLDNVLGEYAVIPGDNWYPGFDKVFGPTHYSFNYGGFHFQFAATDIRGEQDPCSVFSPESKTWMEQDLADNTNRPCIFVIHETVWPASFLDAPYLAELFNANPQVICVFSGHLHLDLQFQRGTWTQFIAPSVGSSHRPGFKSLKFYADSIILESYEQDPTSKEFQQVSKWQRVMIPEKYQSALSRPETEGVPKDISSLPAAPKKVDLTLDQRQPEISRHVLDCVMTLGFKTMLNP
jgi:hypothetical protein